jgi:hypothetical protein
MVRKSRFSIVLSQSAVRDETVRAKADGSTSSEVSQSLDKSKADNTSDHDEQSHLHRLFPHGRAL